jgi:mannose-1-phosphate guanylyltransferase/mannose-6-phosphate isomerase
VKPTRPETGYGYIKAGASKGDGVYGVSRFVEKPDRATAERYLSEGGYYWNSGMFVFRAAVMLDELRTHMPSTYEAFARVESALNTGEEAAAVKEAYAGVEEQSIDYGVMERSGRVSMVAAEFPWSDIGSFNALDEVHERNGDGNVIEGNVVGIDCRNSIFISGERLLAAIGLEDTVVVDTADATLIAPKDRVQQVKDLVNMLKAGDKEEYLSPMIEERPWGHFAVLGHGPAYKIKRIGIKPGGRLSLQMHDHRSEHWIVVAGTARVTRGDEVFDVGTNESTFIPAREKHRLENPGSGDLVIIEIQSGEYLGEDDIIRFDDVYGRNT